MRRSILLTPFGDDFCHTCFFSVGPPALCAFLVDTTTKKAHRGLAPYSQVSSVVVVRNASRSSRQVAGTVLSGSMPVYCPR